MNNYTFKKSFTTKIGSNKANLMMPGSIPSQILEFKVGDKIQGTPSEDGKSIVATPRPNAYVNIPIEFLSTSTSTLFDPNEYGGGINPNGMYTNKPDVLKTDEIFKTDVIAVKERAQLGDQSDSAYYKKILSDKNSQKQLVYCFGPSILIAAFCTYKKVSLPRTIAYSAIPLVLVSVLMATISWSKPPKFLVFDILLPPRLKNYGSQKVKTVEELQMDNHIHQAILCNKLNNKNSDCKFI